MRRFGRLLVALAVAGGASVAASAQARVFRTDGDARHDRLGAALVTLPDVDGDGVPDLLVGSPGRSGYPYPGRAALYSGATGALLREWVGAPDDRLGVAVAQLGDLDGDGIADVALESRTATLVESGGSGAQLYSIANQDGYWSLAAVGDLDGDGFRDLVVASGGNQASVYSGRTGSFIRQHNASSGETWVAVARAGDVDGDGVDDYVVGAISNGSSNGSAYVFSGATGNPIWQLTAGNGQAAFGTSVSGAGDVDGDGLADVAVGNPDWSSSTLMSVDGRVWVFSGATGTRIWGRSGSPQSNEQIGASLSVASDFDGDGVPDLATGCASGGTTSVALLSGAAGSRIGSFLFHHAAAAALDATADLTGDGIAELVAGLPTVMADPLQDLEAGAAPVFDVNNGTTLFELLGESFISHCGSALAVLPDRDGDGYREVAIGIPGGLGDAAGTVEVRSGFDGHLLARSSDAARNTRYGQAITPLDDVSGDGVRDYAVGSPDADAVTILSGADDSVLATIQGPRTGQEFGASLAAGTDAAGHVQLAVGAPRTIFLTTNDGEVSIYDAASGALVNRFTGTHMNGQFGAAVACVGDVDGDGALDWMVGEPNQDVVYALSGATGSTIWSCGATFPDLVGNQIAVLGDLDGDGLADVALGLPYDVSTVGHVLLRSGKDGSAIAQINGSAKAKGFGQAVGALGDVNRDGVPDFAVCGVSELLQPGSGHVDVFSGATRGLLATFPCDDPTRQLGGVLATTDLGSDTRVDPDAIPDLPIGSPLPFLSGGSAELRSLDDLMLQITPDVAAAGQPVDFATRGGPAGNLVGLDLVAFDGSPVQQWLAFGTFATNGAWKFSAVVPPGLSGHSVTLLGFAVGFAGKVVVSNAALLTFQ